jgi:hypothetical protein
MKELKQVERLGIVTKAKYSQLIKVYQMRTGINVSEKSRIQSVVTARQCLFFILRQKYKMKYNTIGWLAEKNHATIIHANKNVRSLLDIRDTYTIDSLEQWASVFKSIFEHSKISRERFVTDIDNAVRTSGLSKEQVNNLLIMKAEEVLE